MIDIDLQHVLGDFTLRAKCVTDEPVVGLFGASGAGKSTLLSLIAGLIVPNTGHLIVNGEYLFDSKRGINVPIYQRHIGMVFQESRLFPHLNVRDNLLYGFNLLPQKTRRLGFSQIVELLEIGHLISQKPHQLSGGEKQRVALGRALLTSPRLLLLDEPLASLDMRLKQQILPFLRRVKEEINIPMIYVSHAIDEILYLTTQILLLEQGKLIAHGDFHTMMNQPSMQAIANSMGLDNVLCATVSKHRPENEYTELKYGEQRIVAPLINKVCGEIVTISIAASHVILSLHVIDNITIENQLFGKVVRIEQINQRVIVSVDIGDSLLRAEVSMYALQTSDIQLGAAVYCLIKAQAVHIHGLAHGLMHS